MAIDQYRNDFIVGDAREMLSQLPESSVNAVMTSPPYWALRDYSGNQASMWGAEQSCEHDSVKKAREQADGDMQSIYCDSCGGWYGELGLEPTPEQYVANIVEVARHIRRVLRPDGSFWLNLGDTFSGGGGVAGKPDDHDDMHRDESYPESVPARDTEYGRKNKLLMPYRVAIALQRDGWVVRNDATWVKTQGLPSPAEDRLNTTTEQLFHLTCNPDYWYNMDAIRESYETGSKSYDGAFEGVVHSQADGKKPSDVFEIAPAHYNDAHFAVMPVELLEKPIQATVAKTVCESCERPYKPSDTEQSKENGCLSGDGRTTDLTQACSCDTSETKRGVVVDPFAGAGTTAIAAEIFGRDWICGDVAGEYVEMARERLQAFRERPEREGVESAARKREIRLRDDERPEWW